MTGTIRQVQQEKKIWGWMKKRYGVRAICEVPFCDSLCIYVCLPPTHPDSYLLCLFTVSPWLHFSFLSPNMWLWPHCFYLNHKTRSFASFPDPAGSKVYPWHLQVMDGMGTNNQHCNNQLLLHWASHPAVWSLVTVVSVLLFPFDKFLRTLYYRFQQRYLSPLCPLRELKQQLLRKNDTRGGLKVRGLSIAKLNS